MGSRLHRHRTERSSVATGATRPRSHHIDQLPVAVLVADSCGRLVEWNRHAAVLLQRSAAALLGASLVDVLGRDLIWSGAEGSVNQTAVHAQLPAGNILDAIAYATSFDDAPYGTRTTVVLAPQAQVATGAPTKVPRVHQWIEVADRMRSLGDPVVCAVVGIVGLHSVNHSYSRSTGDAALTEISRRLVQLAGARSVVERIAGNRFAVVMPSASNAGQTPHRLLDVVREPIDTPLGGVAVGCSIGVTSGDPRSGLVLLDRADGNATVALRRGSGIVERNDSPPGSSPPSTARLAGPLLQAVTQGVISAHFQPVVELAAGTVVEYEALARWNRQDSGNLTAAHFIEAARETGAIVELGAAMLREALDFAAVLRCSPVGSGIRVSVNVSARELADTAFVDLVAAELTRTNLPPDALQIELSDHMGTDEVSQVQGPIAALRGLGVRIALDNFGGRSANLLVLRDLEVDAVKLDAALVATVVERPSEVSLLRSILSLARQLGVDVVAKGVETEAQHQLLRRLGCRLGQGYLYGAPRAAIDLEPLDTGAARRGGGVLLPADEPGRIAKLHALIGSGALDAAHYDDLVDRAAAACGTELAGFGVVDVEHEWIACGHGLGEVTVPRSESLAARAICHDHVSVIDGSYAAAPVRTSDGHAIGALWVAVGSDSIAFEPALLDRLADLAEHVALRIELRHMLAQRPTT